MQIAEIEGRLERLRSQRATSGMLSVAQTAALADVGFTQVSEVMGAISVRAAKLGFFGTGVKSRPRGWQGRPGVAPPVYTSSTWRGRKPARVQALETGYRVALQRLVAEVSAVGGDGAVGVRIEHTTHDESSAEIFRFLATGTAVRSRGTTRASTPFTSALDAAQTAAAMRHGWLPAQYLACPVMAVRWVDAQSRGQERTLSTNGEIAAFTDTVNACRRQAATDFETATRAANANGAVLGDMTLHIGPAPDLAEVTVVVIGTALVRFRAPAVAPARASVWLRGPDD